MSLHVCQCALHLDRKASLLWLQGLSQGLLQGLLQEF